jgi:ATP-dependent Clp protease adaptor protein ClpS
MNPSPNDQPARKQSSHAASHVHALPQWNVVLICDRGQSFSHIAALLREVVRLPAATAAELAATLDATGRAVCFTAHKEHAEFKRDQILEFGKEAAQGGQPQLTVAIEQA